MANPSPSYSEENLGSSFPHCPIQSISPVHSLSISAVTIQAHNITTSYLGFYSAAQKDSTSIFANPTPSSLATYCLAHHALGIPAFFTSACKVVNAPGPLHKLFLRGWFLPDFETKRDLFRETFPDHLL